MFLLCFTVKKLTEFPAEINSCNQGHENADFSSEARSQNTAITLNMPLNTHTLARCTYNNNDKTKSMPDPGYSDVSLNTHWLLSKQTSQRPIYTTSKCGIWDSGHFRHARCTETFTKILRNESKTV